ncbi:hypothetical protein K3495_g5892 [Podosphaera aphanis]|nr:hypothetical protein K3495_g5892 [Podosphaera aphanis]
MKPNSDISHAEIWDDSTLIESWNSAFEEYQKYHSIEARRSKQFEEVNDLTNDSSAPSNNDVTRLCDQEALDSISGSHVQQEATKDVHDQNTDINESISVNNQKPSPNLPMNFIAQVADESLKNLMMSWYYAGYYTGLFEGQQHANAASTKKI